MFLIPRSLRVPTPAAALLAAGLCAAPALAEDWATGVYDVIYVPSPEEIVRVMLDIADVGPNDFVIDLGSGDGRIPIAAARDRGARGFGVDLEEGLVKLSTQKAEEAGVADRVRFRRQNMFDTDVSQATVVTLYLLPDLNVRLRPTLLASLAPGSRVVSHEFDMGDWEPDAVERLAWRHVYLWIVPAQVEGRWRVDTPEAAFDLDLKQTYQRIEGSADFGDGPVPLVEPTLRGADIEFAVERDGRRQLFAGRVGRNTMAAADKDGAVVGWRARRQ